MELQRALTQISEIHAQLLKGEIYRGYRAWPTAITGLIVLAAAAVQASFFAPRDARAACTTWLAVAGVCALLIGLNIYAGYRRQPSQAERRRTLRALAQFAPALAAGAIATAALLHSAPGLLPGLWTLCFSLGLFSSRLHLPRAVGWVALWYLGTGGVLLAGASPAAFQGPWGMGLAFGAGQLALAWVFYTRIERCSDGRS